MNISIEESIRLFKTEIIAQDQRLPQRRSEPLLAACDCLKQRFRSRKNVLAILGMTDGVILYMQKRQATVYPDCLDFMKEAMAHVVNIYEEGRFDPEREGELGNRMYRRFNQLKTDLKKQRAPQAPEAPEGPLANGSATATRTSPATAAVTDAAASSAIPNTDHQPKKATADDTNGTGTDGPAAKARTIETTTAAAAAAKERTDAATDDPPAAEQIFGGHRLRSYAPRPGEKCRLVALGETPLLVADSAIALLEPIKPRQRQKSLAATEISLSEFNRLFRRLPKRFQGPLAAMPAGHLKKLQLPLIMPRGGCLPLLPPEDADHLLVLSHGQWHGVIPVRLAHHGKLTLQSFQPAANGDIAGLGTTDDEDSYPLLNPRTFLEREGFLTTPDQE